MMRKLLLSIAAAGTVMAFSSPAAAQWHRQGYGYNNGPRAGLEHALQEVRIQRDELARSGRLTGPEARDLDNDIRSLEGSIDNSRGPLSRWQARNLENRINRVRDELRRYSDYDGRGRNGHNGHNGRRY